MLTARRVRNLLEHQLGLETDALKSRKDEILSAINQIDDSSSKPSAGDPSVMRGGDALAPITTLAQVEHALDAAKAASDPKEVSRVLTRIELCAASAEMASALVAPAVEGGLVPRCLSPYLAPRANPEVSASAIRILTAISMHEAMPTRLLTSPTDLASLLVSRLATATEGRRLPARGPRATRGSGVSPCQRPAPRGAGEDGH